MGSYDPLTYWNTPRKRNDELEPPLDKQELASLVRALDEIEPRSILEVGSGGGRIIEALPEYIDRITACDFAQHQRQKCFKRTNLMPHAWDGETLPYRDGAFDFVLSFDVLLHVPPDDVRQFLAEHKRVARRWLFIATLADSGGGDLAAHCFRHDCAALWKKANLRVVEVHRFGGRTHWLLGK